MSRKRVCVCVGFQAYNACQDFAMKNSTSEHLFFGISFFLIAIPSSAILGTLSQYCTQELGTSESSFILIDHPGALWIHWKASYHLCFAFVQSQNPLPCSLPLLYFHVFLCVNLLSSSTCLHCLFKLLGLLYSVFFTISLYVLSCHF